MPSDKVIDAELGVTEPESQALVQRYDKPELAIMREPEIVLREAQKAAEALMEVLKLKPKAIMFRGQRYLTFDDWQTCARFYGCTVGVEWTKPVEFGEVRGFECRALVYNSSGQILSSAESMCMSDEDNWKAKPLFQIRSMAQTRACGKALRNVFSFVVVLAGYEPTPAEEMVGTNEAVYPKCENCPRMVLPFVKPESKEKVSAEQVLENGRKRWGKDLCGGCQIGLAQAEKQANSSPAPTETAKPPIAEKPAAKQQAFGKKTMVEYETDELSRVSGVLGTVSVRMGKQKVPQQFVAVEMDDGWKASCFHAGLRPHLVKFGAKGIPAIFLCKKAGEYFNIEHIEKMGTVDFVEDEPRVESEVLPF